MTTKIEKYDNEQKALSDDRIRALLNELYAEITNPARLGQLTSCGVGLGSTDRFEINQILLLQTASMLFLLKSGVGGQFYGTAQSCAKRALDWFR